jgi:cysteine desulfurase / selenocysteine lyase
MFYLDNAATSWPKPESVYQTLDQSFRSLFSPKRGTASASRLGASKLMEAREVIAHLIGATGQDASERIIFTSGATHSLNLAIQAFPWQAGDGVVISAMEHHALSRPVRKMVTEKGIQLHIVPYTTDLPYDLVALEALLKAHPSIKMVATTHASNVIGSIVPVEAVCKLAKEYGKVTLVDAAQSAGVLPLSVSKWGVDLMALPGHKSLYGPPGVGVLWISPDAPLTTFMEGGTGNDSGKHEMHATCPDGFEVGTINMPSILALAEGVRWVQETGIEKIHAHEIALLETLLAGLNQLEGLTVYGHQRVQEKTPVVSFNLKGVPPKILGETLFNEFGIALRAGFHCAPMAHECLGTIPLGGTVRASLGYFTQPEDVEALISALKQTIQQGLCQQPA